MADLDKEFEGYEGLDAEFESFEPAEPAEPAKPTELEALARGAAQGVTFGFSDELEALLSTAGQKLTSDEKKTFWDMYDEEVSKIRMEYKEAEEEHPGYALTGEIAGAVLPALATGGTSLLGLGARGAAKVAGTVGAKGAAKAAGRAATGIETLAKAPGLAPKVAKMGLLGAEAGAVYGAGKAEEDVLSEIASGAAMGAITGGALQAAGSAIKAASKEVGKIVGKQPFFADLKETALLQKEGIDILGKESKYYGQLQNIADDIITVIPAFKKMAGKEIGEIFEKAGKQLPKDKPVNLGEIVGSIKKTLDPEIPEHKRLIKELDTLMGTEKEEVLKFVRDISRKSPMAKAEEKVRRRVTAQDESAKFGYKAAAIKNYKKEMSKWNTVTEGLEAQQEAAILAGKMDEAEALALRLEEHMLTKPELPSLAKIEKKAAVKSLSEYPPKTTEHPLTEMEALVSEPPLDVEDIAEGLLTSRRPVVEPLPGEFTPVKLIKEEKVTQQLAAASPDELITFRNKLNEIRGSFKGQGIEDEAMRRNVEEIRRRVDDKLLDSLPGDSPLRAELKEAKRQYHKLSKTYAEMGHPQYVSTEQAMNMAKKAKEKLVRSMEHYQRSLSKEELMGGEAANQAQQFLQDITDIIAISSPDTAASLRKQMQVASRRLHLAREIMSQSQLTGTPEKLFATPKALSMIVARAIGKAMRIGDQISKSPIIRKGQEIYTRGADEVADLAAKAEARGSHFAGTLRKAAEAPDRKRKALLYTLMQQKDFRDFLDEE